MAKTMRFKRDHLHRVSGKDGGAGTFAEYKKGEREVLEAHVEELQRLGVAELVQGNSAKATRGEDKEKAGGK